MRVCGSVKRDHYYLVACFSVFFLRTRYYSLVVFFVFFFSSVLVPFIFLRINLDLEKQFFFPFVYFVLFCAAALYHKSYIYPYVRAVTYSYVRKGCIFVSLYY